MVRPLASTVALVVLVFLVRVAAAQPSATPPATEPATVPATEPEGGEVALALHGGAMTFGCLCEGTDQANWGPFLEAALTKRSPSASAGLYASVAYFSQFSHLNSDELTYRYSHAQFLHTGGRVALGGADDGYEIGVGLGLIAATDDDPHTHGGVFPTVELFTNIIFDRFDTFGTSVFGVLDVTPTGDAVAVSLRFGIGFESY